VPRSASTIPLIAKGVYKSSVCSHHAQDHEQQGLAASMRDDGTTDAAALAGNWGTVGDYMCLALGHFVLPSDVACNAL